MGMVQMVHQKDVPYRSHACHPYAHYKDQLPVDVSTCCVLS